MLHREESTSKEITVEESIGIITSKADKKRMGNVWVDQHKSTNKPKSKRDVDQLIANSNDTPGNIETNSCWYTCIILN